VGAWSHIQNLLHIDQIGVSGLLEAASWLLQQGFKPKRTLMFVFGQDEEVGGDMGAGT
jgi:carboxypeptidase PM20D1